jgi:TonB family protein
VCAWASSIDRSQITSVVHAHAKQIRACLEQVLPDASIASGKVVVEFVIGAEGRVTGARVKQDTYQAPDLETCMVNEILTWRFPRPMEGPVTITFPFTFDVARCAGTPAPTRRVHVHAPSRRGP